MKYTPQHEEVQLYTFKCLTSKFPSIAKHTERRECGDVYLDPFPMGVLHWFSPFFDPAENDQHDIC